MFVIDFKRLFSEHDFFTKKYGEYVASKQANNEQIFSREDWEDALLNGLYNTKEQMLIKKKNEKIISYKTYCIFLIKNDLAFYYNINKEEKTVFKRIIPDDCISLDFRFRAEDIGSLRINAGMV